MGVTIRDLKLAESNGICKGTLYSRLQRGWPKQKALTEPVETEKMKWLKVAKENGISEKTFDYRYYYGGYSYEEAATRPLSNAGRKKVKK